ncbi:neutral zinc metallopeptidase [Parasediminibacterium sp. JCM 36343]|uniref:KPN_02809 family neutral zinc metallopeptidase n=1 Tax=Parasediminibacterium sp. JCM 36343 TaxID=3374279 RepID=UPI00397CD58D
MDWRGLRESDNIEDRRGSGGLLVGGGVIGTIIAAVIYLLGGNQSAVLPPSQQAPASQNTRSMSTEDDSTKHFVGVVLAETEDVWGKLFTEMGKHYSKPKLVLFTRSTQSGCGGASSATGPFYCPSDQKVYLDISFFNEMQNRFNVAGNFASAYVVAHEVGHHVQDLLGISSRVSRLQQQGNQSEANKLSVKLELQADFMAGIWAHYAKDLHNNISLEDIQSALNAANAIGDDRLQKEAQGYVVPDAFTHGTSKQRMYWFKKGFDTGDISKGDTFLEN